jgi:uncharacterized membrane protein YkvA (DUF1232 family)
MLITHLNLLSLMKEAEVSFEELGQYMDISGMTLRRWASEPKKKLDPLYESSFQRAVYKLIAESRLKPDSKTAKIVLSATDETPLLAVLTSLGLDLTKISSEASSSEKLIIGIGQIGSAANRREMVERSTEKINDYKKIGAEWTRPVTALLKVISSKKLSHFEKFAAFGALFYLISPIDLIPDAIPVFGLIDDFAILTLVAGYYANKFILTED